MPPGPKVFVHMVTEATKSVVKHRCGLVLEIYRLHPAQRSTVWESEITCRACKETKMKPLLFLDVDGVLQRNTTPEDVFSPETDGPAIRSLMECFEVMWATTWEDEANQIVSPALGLPSFPVVRFDHEELTDYHETFKLPTVRRACLERPMAWVDDDLGADAKAWAEQRRRRIPTLLVHTSYPTGLLPEDVDILTAFGKGLL